LIVPEVNGAILNGYKGIIANPNCSTIQLVLILKPLHDFKKIKKVVVTTMQSVSGSGYKGVIEMQNQRMGKAENKLYPRLIDMNVIPQIGDFGDDGFCEEEQKMTFETKKILNDPDFNLVATTVRVPVVYGHSESVYIEFYDDIDLNDIVQILINSDAVKYENDYMTPLQLGESNTSHVSRIRYAGDKKSIILWNVAHNIRLGAATNAVKILKKCFEW
jgi:aspartate-semialdehyde dehydrogenase